MITTYFTPDDGQMVLTAKGVRSPRKPWPDNLLGWMDKLDYVTGRSPPHYPVPVPENELISWCDWVEEYQCFLSWCYGELDTF